MKIFIKVLFLASLAQSAFALDEFKLFENDQILNMKLSGDLSSDWEERDKEKRIYHKVILSSTTIRLNIKVKVRGNRRGGYYMSKSGDEKLVCTTPLLKFKNIQKNSAPFYFVSHCNDNELNSDYDDWGIKGGNNYLLREYLAYKIQSILTHNYPKVRLIKMQYQEDVDQSCFYERYGFFVENFKVLAINKDMNLLKEQEYIELNPLSYTHSVRQGLFQYIIGNSDFFINKFKRHNYQIFLDKNNTFIPMAFDFNQSAISYLSEYSHNMLSIPISCPSFNKDQFRTIANEIIGKEKLVLKTINDLTQLKESERKLIITYIKDQFIGLKEILENDNIYLRMPYNQLNKNLCTIKNHLF